MSKGKSDKISYKPCDQGQAYLIPPCVDELIPANHLVRLVRPPALHGLFSLLNFPSQT
jgi:hypothetical protein